MIERKKTKESSFFYAKNVKKTQNPLYIIVAKKNKDIVDETKGILKMIKIDKETTIIAGELNEILSDTTTILRKVYQVTKENLGEETANEYLVKIGRMAVMSEEELTKFVREEPNEQDEATR